MQKRLSIVVQRIRSRSRRSPARRPAFQAGDCSSDAKGPWTSNTSPSALVVSPSESSGTKMRRKSGAIIAIA